MVEELILAIRPDGRVIEVTPCHWRRNPDDAYYDVDTWVTDCGQEWQFMEGKPDDNRVRYCHYCGGKVIIVEKPDE